MKKSIFNILIVVGIISSAGFTACQSTTPKEDAAKAKLEAGREDLKEAQTEASAEEWEAFKKESEIKINNNNIRIAELRLKMTESGNNTLDIVYKKRILLLEQKNIDMKARIDAYEKSQSDWESFKREFNHDMDELGKALKDIAVDNKK